MNWLSVSLVAQIILGTSAVFDKLLLRRNFFDPWVYTFWTGILGLLVVFFIPFTGFHAVPLITVFTALLAGGTFTLASFFFFLALKKSDASVVLPIIGGLAPLFTFLVGLVLLKDFLTTGELIGFVLLLVGGVTLLGAEKKAPRLQIFGIALISAALFGLSNVLTKIVFNASPFMTGMIWIRLGGALLVALPLAFRALRVRVLKSTHESTGTNRTLYLTNRFYAGIGGILGVWAIALGHPALVDASAGLKYVVIFLGAWLLLRESFHGKVLFIKLTAAILIVGGLAWLGFVGYVRSTPLPPPIAVTWGVTFSELMSKRLNLDWRENYRAILDDLRPGGVRLVAYWDRVEPNRSEFDFANLDWQMDEASKSNIPVILAIGQRVPRWPECHYPEWLNQNDNELREKELLKYIGTVIERYRSHSALYLWQIENEPFLLFGECPPVNPKFLDQEIALTRTLDPQHQILLTDGGEFGNWYQASRRGDVFGATLYRKVHNRFFGYITYPLTPEFFPLKKSVVQFLTRKPDQKFVVIELGLEPWGEKQIYEMSVERQFELFNLSDFKDTIEYARQARFDTYYMWGAEWWYWLKVKHNDSRFWDEARNIFQYK